MSLTPAEPDRAAFSKLRGEARELALHRHDCPIYQEFWQRHAIPTKIAPSCLVCGKSMVGEQVAIQHMELPNIVVCFQCRDKATL
jgi:hypothetical protein